MVDSRDKGARAETAARDVLRQYTGYKWERVPGSGALGAQHKLKGDLYIPEANNVFCVEIKHYADDHLTSKILTDKDAQFMEWWEQTIRESAQVGKHPLLIYKFDRSKWFVAFKALDFVPYDEVSRVMEISYNKHHIATMKLEEWLSKHKDEVKWVA